MTEARPILKPFVCLMALPGGCGCVEQPSTLGKVVVFPRLGVYTQAQLLLWTCSLVEHADPLKYEKCGVCNVVLKSAQGHKEHNPFFKILNQAFM